MMNMNSSDYKSAKLFLGVTNEADWSRMLSRLEISAKDDDSYSSGESSIPKLVSDKLHLLRKEKERKVGLFLGKLGSVFCESKYSVTRDSKNNNITVRGCVSDSVIVFENKGFDCNGADLYGIGTCSYGDTKSCCFLYLPSPSAPNGGDWYLWRACRSLKNDVGYLKSYSNPITKELLSRCIKECFNVEIGLGNLD
jgi:hypothetical protein